MTKTAILNLALLQTELHWENPAANRSKFETLIRKLSSSTDVAVLPEMFSTGFTMNPENVDDSEGGKTREWMLALAKETNMLLIGSTVFAEKGNYFNRLFAAFPDGRCLQYDKRHTFTLAGEDQVYEAGSERLEFEYKGFRICPLICYDLRFPVWSRNTNDYDLLLYVANWPLQRVAAWDALLKARAIENMAYVAGVNRVGEDGGGYAYNGHTAVYDMLGEQLCFRGDSEGVLEVQLSRDTLLETRKKFRFLQDRDRFTLEL